LDLKNGVINFATSITTSFDFFTAISLNMALPPTVNAATMPEQSMLNQNIILSFWSAGFVVFSNIAAEHAPLIMPHISPMTSAQMLLTRSEFFTSLTATFPPLTLRDAIESNGASSQEVVATAIASNNMLTLMRTRINAKETSKCAYVAVSSEIYENAQDNIKVTITILIIQIVVFFEDRLSPSRFRAVVFVVSLVSCESFTISSFFKGNLCFN
jgi:hypothetical protein